ncbi:MAG: LTA synthase family protein [Spirochaetaceae bacterium]
MTRPRISVPPAALVAAAAAVCFLLLYLAGRPLLAEHTLVPRIGAPVLFADGLFAIFVLALSLAVARAHVLLGVLVLTLLVVYRTANMEMVAAMSTVPSLWDLRFAGGRFLSGSAANLSFAGYALGLLASGIAAVVLSRRRLRRRHAGLAAAIAVGAVLAVSLLTPAAASWQTTDLTYRSLQKTVAVVRGDGLASDVDSDAGEETEGRPPGPPLAAADAPYFERADGARRNVLLLILEGIPGAYLRQVQDYFDTESPVTMEQLSDALEEADAFFVPSFVAHNRQTIRGLYALLAGDPSRPTARTPKAYDYLSLPAERRPPLLPELLHRSGYRTHFLQAADLGYMSKDRFMPAAGFETVLGAPHFDYSYAASEWGPDDKAFLEQSLSYIKELRATNATGDGDNGSERPWFLTMLTVGTHHPYAVPDDFAADYDNERTAAVAYLDEALGEFFRELEHAGVFEDTMVVLTSDESHGVVDHPHGRYWAPLVLIAPEGTSGVNEGVYGLVDVPTTILDYLGLHPVPPHLRTHSALRPQEEARELTFGSFYTREKGTFYQPAGAGGAAASEADGLLTYTTPNDELFASHYENRESADAEASEILARIEEIHAGQKWISGAGGEETGSRRYTLLENDRFRLGPAAETLTSGQYLSLPAASTVTVTLEARAEGRPVRLTPQVMQVDGELGVGNVEVPLIPAGGEARLRFRFPVEEETPRVWAVLFAEIADADDGGRRGGRDEGAAAVEIVEYSLSVDTEEQVEAFEVTEREVRDADDGEGGDAADR